MPNEECHDINKLQGEVQDDALKTLSLTCSMTYNRISKKQYECLQAMMILQPDMLDSCNGLIKNQVDLLEEYSNKGIVSKEQMLSIVRMPNDTVEGYLSYVSLQYDLILARMQRYHKVLTTVNTFSPKLTELYVESLRLLKSYAST